MEEKQEEKQSEIDAKNESKSEEEMKIQDSEIEETEEIRKLKRNIHKAFEIFKHVDEESSEDRISCKQIGSAIRYLGEFPSESVVQEVILPSIRNGDNSIDNIRYPVFESHMLRILEGREFPPADHLEMLSVFAALDTENLGYITLDRLQTLMDESDNPLTDEAFDAFVETALDKETGRFYYDDYAQLYDQQVSYHRDQLRRPVESKVSH